MTFQNMNQRGVSSSPQFPDDTSFRPKRNVGIWKPKHTSDQHSQVRLSGKDVPSSSKSTIVGSFPEEKPYKSLEEMDADTLANLLPDEDELFSDLFDGFGYNSHEIKNGESEDFVFSSGGGMELEGSEILTSVNRTSGVQPCRTLFVRNIDSNVEDFELKAIFEQCGKIRYFYTACKKRGFVMVSYFDVKTAQNAMQTLQNRQLRSRNLDIHYSFPKGNARKVSKPKFHPHSLPQCHGSSAKGNFSNAISNKTVNIGTRGTCDGRHIQGMSSTGNVAEFNGGGFPDYGVHHMWNHFNMHQQPSTFPRSNLSSNTWKSSTKPLQLAQILHGRPPMTSISKVGFTNERMRSFHHQKSEANTNFDDKKQYELDLDCILCGVDRRTTLMIKNIPNKYTSSMLIDAIDGKFRGTYDFLYLPIDFKHKCNVGYAFINMTNPIQIIPFHQAFNGKKWEKFNNSAKVASISYARIQGRDSLVAHFQNSSVMNEDRGRRPILFRTNGPNVGDMEPFPIGDKVRFRINKSYLAGSGNMENHGQGSSSST